MKIKGELFLRAENNYAVEAASFLYKNLDDLENKSLKEKIFVALSGGTTPLSVLTELKKLPLNWKRYCFFLVDERCVPASDLSSNFGNLSRCFFDALPSVAYPLYRDGCRPEESAATYARLLLENLPHSNSFPQFDLILLGLGDDGHTASLFPGTLALNEFEKSVVVNEIPQLNTQRITLTYPVLLNARDIIVMAKGPQKQQVIEELYADNAPPYPMLKIVEEYSRLKWIIG
jgi:6-phosphogluconolactonase